MESNEEALGTEEEIKARCLWEESEQEVISRSEKQTLRIAGHASLLSVENESERGTF